MIFVMYDLSQSLFLRALKRQPVARTPVWVMRQAGRYLPEYRAVREKAGDFLSLCKNPELACEVTLQPLRRFALDAAILFSDILTIPDAMGLGLYFAEGEGPKFMHPLRTVQSINDLSVPDVLDSLGYVFDAARMIRQEMPKELPLIGFSGSPWTLACYMVEGSSSKSFERMFHLKESETEAAENLLDKLAQSVTDYLMAQVEAGVNVLMIFDTWGGLLSTHQYQRYSLKYMQQIIKKMKAIYPDIPVILFTKGGGQWLELMVDTGCDAIGLDWTCSMGQARGRVGHQVALQGNLEPSILLQSPQQIRQGVLDVLTSYGEGSGHIFNLGHGITPDVPPEHLAVMVEAVHELSPMFQGNTLS
jgi:uroporphyrinogen decarboxylase